MSIETTSLDLGDSGKEFTVKWYNPREGGDLLEGSVKTVTANGIVRLGNPPADQEKDWVALVQRTN